MELECPACGGYDAISTDCNSSATIAAMRGAAIAAARPARIRQMTRAAGATCRMYFSVRALATFVGIC